MNWQKRRSLVNTSLLMLLANLLPGPAGAADLNWLTDLPKAQDQARNEKKLVLMNFTGSDWCPWCAKLKKEVFNTKEFEEFAAKNLVLLEVDFPRTKKQSDELQRANAQLKKKYAEHDGFPTIAVLKSDGKGAWRLVWKQIGCSLPGETKPLNAKLDPKNWIARMDDARKK